MKKLALFIIAVVIIAAIYLIGNNRNTKTPVATVPITSTEGIILRENGLGIVSFGASSEETLAILTPLLGQPTKDTGWVDSFSSYGTCPGDSIRGVEWNNLHVLFGDTLYGKKAFFGFEYVNRDGTIDPILETEKSITLGATKEAIKAVYPSATFGDWLPGQTGTTFIRGAEGSGEYLGGTLEDNKLFWIGGGIFCGE